MTMPIKTAVCPSCAESFEKLFAHQKFCTTYCAFWARVMRTNKCWIWTGSKHRFGYGEFRYNGQLYRAHVFSYFIHYGVWGNSTHILHHCDVPRCVCPSHLYEGTQKDNLADAVRRGRMLKKLTLEQVKEIERRLRAGDVMLRIAKDFGVSHPAIRARKQRMIREGRLEPTIGKVMREDYERAMVKTLNEEF